MVVPNLINGQSYAFHMSAENRDGEGAYAVSSIVDAGTGGLVILSVDALNVASGGVNVHQSDEGSPLTGPINATVPNLSRWYCNGGNEFFIVLLWLSRERSILHICSGIY